jgi:hypothetical protein
MRTYIRKRGFSGNFISKHKGGGYMRHQRLKHEGLGVSGDMYKEDKPNASCSENLTRHDFLTIKPLRKKKYVSLNL